MRRKSKSFLFKNFLLCLFIFIGVIFTQQELKANNSEHIVISELQITGGAGKTKNDFIELYNPTNASFNLKGHRLVKRTKTGSTDTTIKSWTSDALIPSYGYYLWANSADGFANSINADVSTTQTIANNNGIALRLGKEDEGEIIDSVGWGSCVNIFVEGTVFPTNPGANQSLERNSNVDTDNNSADFFIQDVPNPQNSSWEPEPYCGDGNLDLDEECDLGPDNGVPCSPTYDSSCLYCSDTCEEITLTGPYCGDGNTDDPEEECDDGNLVDGDGCSAECTVEIGPVCGNNIVETGEECDDSNTQDGDGCSALCITEYCGDNIVNNVDEECDDGDNVNGDGCSSTCQAEVGPTPYCGDGSVDPGDGSTGSPQEECDDGNLVDGDGCSANCQIEEISPKAIKEQVKENLENSKTGNWQVDKKINQVLKYINKSLKDRYWVDEYHLKPGRKGLTVFYAEYDAVIKMQDYLHFSKQSKCHKHRKHHKHHKRHKCPRHYQLPEQVIAVFEQAIADLVKADRILTETVLEEAKNTPVNNPKYQKRYNRMISRAQAKINKALRYEENKPDKAMDLYDRAWQFAQEAMEYAARD